MRILSSTFWFAIFVFRAIKCEAVNFIKYSLACVNLNFGREKILLGNFLEFIGNGIGMPVKTRNKIFEIWVARNSVAQRIPGK